MKKIIFVVLALVGMSFAQQATVESIGQITTFGSIFTLAPVTIDLPDPALLAWNTTIANTPASGPTICVGVPANASLLPGGQCSGGASSNFAATATGLQSALTAAVCGEVINVANTVGYGPITLPVGAQYNCSQSNWIWLTRDLSDTTFPAEGTRVDPCYTGIPQSSMPYYPYPSTDATPNTCGRHMPQFVNKASLGGSSLDLANPPTSGANTRSLSFWRIMGLDLTRDTTADIGFAIVSFTFQPANAGQDCALNNSLNVTSIANGGTGYVVGDVLNIVQSGASGGQIKVTATTTGGVIVGGTTPGYTFVNYGHGYATAIPAPVVSTTGGSGTGATITITSINGANALPLTPDKCILDQPHDIILDRMLIHGDAQRQTSSGLTLAGVRRVAVLDSYGYDIGTTEAGGSGDAHFYGWGAGHGYDGVGFGKFQNNFSAASTMGSLFCGAQTDPFLPSVGVDGVPTNVWWYQDFLWKNPLWDTQIGQTLNETITIEGQSYPPAGDQELVSIPSAVQISQGSTMPIHLYWGNDSASGLNRVGNAVGTATIDGITCPFANGFCIVGGSSATGVITRGGEVAVGTGQQWQSQNQILYSYVACTGVAAPLAACTTATTGTHSVVFSATALNDGRITLSSLGNPRQLTATTTVTVTATPTNLIAVSPSAPDLRLQPSYSDAFGNTRQFCYTFFELDNFAPGAITWKVDGTAGGDAITKGTIQSGLTGLATNEAVYCTTGAVLGTHTITATDGTTIGTSTVTVSATAPILDYDWKPYTSKNAWETKCGSHMLLESSLIEIAFGSQGNGGGQGGNAALTQCINQTNQSSDGTGAFVPWGPAHIDNITFRNDVFRHMGGGIVLAALNQGLGIHSIKMSNILFDDVNYQRWNHGFNKFIHFLQYGGTASTTPVAWATVNNPLVSNTLYQHLTMVGKVTGLMSVNNNIAQFPMINLVIQDSILAADTSTTFTNDNGENNDCNRSSGTGSSNTESLTFLGSFYTPPKPCVAPYTFNHLALLNNTSTITVAGGWPSALMLWQPNPSTATDLFASYTGGNGGDYRLCTGVDTPVVGCTAGTYTTGVRKASDGTPLGADITGLGVIETQVKTGVRTP